MTARIVYEGLHKTFRYERNQHGDIDESEDPFKCEETPFKDNSEKDKGSEEKEEVKDEINQRSSDHFSKESLVMNREISTPVDSELNNDALITEIREIRKEVHTLVEKISTPLERIANFFEKYQDHFLSSHHNTIFSQINNENQNIKQSDVVLHQIEDYEKVREKYPYEVFVRDELPNLDSKSKKEYQRLCKLAENIEPLAFYLYKNQLLTEQTMKSFLVTYKEFSNMHDDFDLKKLKSIYIEKDLKELENKETLTKKWKQWRRIWMISYGVSPELFPQIKFSSKKKAKEQESFTVSKEIIKEAWETLSKNGKHAESLMIYLMSAFELSPDDVRLLKFEDIALKNKQATINIFKLKSNSKQRIPISDSLYKKIMKYQKDLTKNNKSFMANRSTKTETIVGHFLFKDSKSSIIKKFKTKFGGLLNNFNICPKGLRISAINDKESEGSPRENTKFEEKKTSNKTKECLHSASKEVDQTKKLKNMKKH